MKKLITLATVLALVVSMFTPILSTSVSADDGGHGVTEIDQAIDGVTLDGVINYAEWGEATHTYGADSWWFKHDSEKLYIAISIDAASSLADRGVSVYANVGTADERRIALDWTADGTFTWQWVPADPEGKAATFSDGSKLVYEIAVLKNYAEPLLFQIPRDCEEYKEAKRLLKFLDYFLALPTEGIAQNSLAREFIGGSCFNV